jgi:pyridoxamine 5'-phosphate oxidase family protein
MLPTGCAPRELNWGSTRRFGSVEANPQAALVVADLASVDLWRLRGIEIRARAKARRGVDPPMPVLSREPIMTHPERIGSQGMSPS